MAKTATYSLIDSITLGSNQSSLTFSNIPSTFTDLVLVANIKKATGVISVLKVTLNSDTGSNYSYTRLIGNGTSASSDRTSNDTGGAGGYITTTQYNNIINFLDYSNTTTYKTFLVRTNNERVAAFINLWRSTSAITSIKLEEVVTADISSGSTFKLYGIEAGNL